MLYCPCAHSTTLHIRSVLLKVKKIDPVINPPWMSSQVLYDSTVVKICLYKAGVRSTCMYILFQPMLKQALGEWSSRSPRMAPSCHRHLQRACKPTAPWLLPNGTAWDKSYQKLLLIIVAFEVAPFSLSGKNMLQLIFRVNCSTCSVTLR